MHLQTVAATVLPLAFGLVAAQSEDVFGYANRQLPLAKDDDIIAENFPEVDIELLSPAFLYPDDLPEGWENGTSTATPELQQEQFLRNLSARNDWMTYIAPDFLSEEGRPFPYLFLTNKKSPQTSGNDTKLRVLIEAHIHGNEPASEQGVLALLGKMDDNSTWTESLLEKMDIMVIPRISPDGVAYFQRQLATGYDPNRDFAVMGRQQTRDLIGLYTKYAPHIFLDAHEYGASSRFGEDGNLVNPADCEVHSMAGLNVHEDIYDLEHNLFVRNMYDAMERNDLRTSPYFTAQQNTTDFSEPPPHAQYALTHNSLRQTISILTESRGIRLGNQHFQRRTAAQLVLLTELLQTAADNADRVYETMESAREEFINSNDDIAITAQPRSENVTWTFIDANNGSLVDVEVSYQNYTPSDANLTRSRPEAYIFTRAWGDVAERMRIAGVEVEQLNFPFNAEVEALVVETSTLAEARFEGIVHNTVTTTSYTRNVSIPAGAYWISTRQVNAAIAMSFLEPEDVASAVTYNVIPLSEGEESPVYRVMRSDDDDE